MMSGKSLLIGLLTVVVVVVGIYFISKKTANLPVFKQDASEQAENVSQPKESFQDLTEQTQVSISMKDLAYSPSNITVSPGTVVVWKNNDTILHFVTINEKNSPSIEPGEEYSMLFETPGEYSYYCSAHTAQNMTGVISVK